MDVTEQESGGDVRKSTDAERQMTLMAPAQYVNNFFVTVVAPGVRLTLTETYVVSVQSELGPVYYLSSKGSAEVGAG